MLRSSNQAVLHSLQFWLTQEHHKQRDHALPWPSHGTAKHAQNNPGHRSGAIREGVILLQTHPPGWTGLPHYQSKSCSFFKGTNFYKCFIRELWFIILPLTCTMTELKEAFTTFATTLELQKTFHCEGRCIRWIRNGTGAILALTLGEAKITPSALFLT